MNLGDLKAFINDVKSPVDRGRNDDVRARLQQEGLRQAAEGVAQTQATFSRTSISSNTFVGLRVYSSSLNQSVLVDRQRPNLPVPARESEKPAFDFEEVATNVMRFVGGVIRGAAARGADEEELETLFSQAQEGVLKGVNLARKDLEGFMNEEIEDGINNSQNLIGEELAALRREVFGEGEGEDSESGQASVSIEQSVSVQRASSADVTIRTRDGDEVNIRFEDLQQFEFNRSLLIESLEPQPQTQPESEPEPPTQTAPADSLEEPAQANPLQGAEPSLINVQGAPDLILTPETEEAEQGDPQGGTPQSATPVAAEGEGQSQGQGLEISVEESYQRFERSGLSFSVQGELGAGEIEAIGSLVGDTLDLARDFFAGDVDAAFDRALDLGFDERELTGFALQLTRFEQAQVVQTYETVSSFNSDNKRDELDATQATRPVARYLERLLDVFDQASNRLDNNTSFEKLINGLFNEVEDLNTPDFISAINRFNQFNNRLIQNLPRAEAE